MQRPFREHHLLQFFETWDPKAPLDFSLYTYFKQRKALGSKDRQWIREMAIFLVRMQRKLDFPQPHGTWESRLARALSTKVFEPMPKAVEYSFPDELYKCLENAFPMDVEKIVACANTKAPLTLRANLLKTDRAYLLEAYPKSMPTEYAPHGLTLPVPIQFQGDPLYQQGYFEVQDEGSQLIAEAVQIQSGELFLDWCAGSGGKSLAVAANMQGVGALYLHDVRSRALQEAKKRLKRAGVQNGQILASGHKEWKRLKKKIDWVLVDAPCSGTGTLRRSPEMRWRFTLEGLQEIVRKQRAIFEKALSFVKPGGHIIYATCSLLKEENSEQIEYFIQKYPVAVVGEPFQSVPQEGKMDGFFYQTLKSI